MTQTEAQQKFPVRMRRGDVLSLGCRLGLSERTVRGLIEGGDAPIKGIIYEGTTRKYFDRDQVIRALFHQPAMAS
jgi:hypothetical protein